MIMQIKPNADLSLPLQKSEGLQNVLSCSRASTLAKQHHLGIKEHNKNHESISHRKDMKLPAKDDECIQDSTSSDDIEMDDLHEDFVDEECGKVDCEASNSLVVANDNVFQMRNRLRQGSVDEQSEHSRAKKSERFADARHITLILSKAAYRYGTPTGRLEEFAAKIMESYGYPGCYFCATRTELTCAFASDDDQCVQLVKLEEGFNMDKLGYLASIMDEVFKKKGPSRDYVRDVLQRVDDRAEPFGISVNFLSNLFLSAGIANLVGGSWIDIALASITCIATFWISYIFGQRDAKPAVTAVVTSFVSSTVASFIFCSAQVKLNVVLVTFSSIILQLPGFGINLAIRELLSDHIVAGLSRLITNFVLLLWLVLGGWLGITFVRSISGNNFDANTGTDATSSGWIFLFGPMTMIALCVALQISPRDIPAATLNQALTYGATSLVQHIAQNSDLGSFVGGFVLTVSAHLWSKWKRRSATIFLLPGLLLMASATTGFKGLTSLLEGERDIGVQQLFQMFRSSILLFSGVGTGQLLVPSPATVL